MLVMAIGSLLIVGSCDWGTKTPDARPVRALPESATPGQEFQVTVTFTSPGDGFWNVGVRDSVPAGWSVSVDEGWCTPPADFGRPAEQWTVAPVEYAWMGFLSHYSAGQEFTTVYRVRVPGDAQPGKYEFGGVVEYYIGEDGPYEQEIGGDGEVRVKAATAPG